MAKRGASIGIYFNVKRMPGAIIDERKLERELRAELKEVAQKIKSDFELTTATFREKPAFKVWGPLMQGPVMITRVSTDSTKYRYLDEGTKAHPIPRGRGKKLLYFQWGGKGSYRAKTRANAIHSWAGGPSGPFVLRKQVHHPGIQARRFAFYIAMKRAPDVEARIARAVVAATQQGPM